jgi:hypothetical protein
MTPVHDISRRDGNEVPLYPLQLTPKLGEGDRGIAFAAGDVTWENAVVAEDEKSVAMEYPQTGVDSEAIRAREECVLQAVPNQFGLRSLGVSWVSRSGARRNQRGLQK